jgi:hypothetical protein
LVLSPEALSPVVNCPMAELLVAAGCSCGGEACAADDPGLVWLSWDAPEGPAVAGVSAGLGFLGFLTFLGGGGGGKGTLWADGGGNGEASGVSVFSACCVVGGGSSVPLPVFKGGAWACCDVTGVLCEHPVHKMASDTHNERSCAALIPWAPWLRWIQLSCSRPA